MKNGKKVYASILGKSATIIATDEALQIYTTSTWIIIITFLVFAGLGIAAAVPTGSLVITALSMLICSVLGYYLAAKVYIGKLNESFDYDDIEVIKYTAPEFTIYKKNNHMFFIRMLPSAQEKLMLILSEQVAQSGSFQMEYKNGGFYINRVTGEQDKA